MTNFNKSQLTRGSIWWIQLDPTIGREQAKTRPCLIISSTTYNSGHSELVIILPITSTFRSLYWFVELSPSQTGLKKDCYVICDQIRSVSLDRIQGQLTGCINNEILKSIEARLQVLFQLKSKTLRNLPDFIN